MVFSVNTTQQLTQPFRSEKWKLSHAWVTFFAADCGSQTSSMHVRYFICRTTPTQMISNRLLCNSIYQQQVIYQTPSLLRVTEDEWVVIKVETSSYFIIFCVNKTRVLGTIIGFDTIHFVWLISELLLSDNSILKNRYNITLKFAIKVIETAKEKLMRHWYRRLLVVLNRGYLIQWMLFKLWSAIVFNR